MEDRTRKLVAAVGIVAGVCASGIGFAGAQTDDSNPAPASTHVRHDGPAGVTGAHSGGGCNGSPIEAPTAGLT